jgi:hypothetical protein
VLAAQGNEKDALEQFARELEFEGDGQLYARECSANTWYAVGALHLRRGRRHEADAAFREASNRVPGHPLAAVVCGLEPRTGLANSVDTAMLKAAALVLEEKHEDAARICAEALARADSGPAGWILPVEPLLNPLSHPGAWRRTLALLRDRAA